jgi:hypothetical protein
VSSSPALLWRRREYIAARTELMRLEKLKQPRPTTAYQKPTGNRTLGRHRYKRALRLRTRVRQAAAALELQVLHDWWWTQLHRTFNVDEDAVAEMWEMVSYVGH